MMARHGGSQGLLIWDLDGTLFRTEAVSVSAVRHTFQARGLPVPDWKEIVAFFGEPTSAWHAWLRSLCPPESAAAVIAEVDRRELELVDQDGRLYPGMREVLGELRGLAAQMAICSNGSRTYVERVVETQGLGPFFDVVRYRASDHDSKPAMVAELLARLPARPAVVIGDRGEDVEAGHRNGLAVIAAAYGYGTAEEVAAADAVARSPGELPSLVRALL